MTALFIGLMSGTSVDAVDSALIEISAHQITLLDFHETAIPAKLKKELVELNQTPDITLHALADLHHQVAACFIQATQEILLKNQLDAHKIDALGSHGQTIFHAPDIPMTLQIGHPAFIAKESGITTVADFRVDDMALGGQGAPFAPAFHNRIFSEDKASVVVNIGGIANLSYLPGKQSNQPVTGWDTGPGNGLMDQLCQQKFGCQYDQNGELARQGNIHHTLVERLLNAPYFSQPAPKSTGRETFNLDWVLTVMSSMGGQVSDRDLLASLCELTAKTIANEIQNTTLDTGNVWIVGGGAYNPFLISRIQHHLPRHQVKSSHEYGINPSAIEAMMCAWLAHERLNHSPVQLSSVTGAVRDAVMGGVWHP